MALLVNDTAASSSPGSLKLRARSLTSSHDTTSAATTPVYHKKRVRSHASRSTSNSRPNSMVNVWLVCPRATLSALPIRAGFPEHVISAVG